MFPGAKVIAIDDDLVELSRIVASLRSLGISCISYNYPNEIPLDFNFSGIRAVFLDINLIGGNSNGQDPIIFNAPISLLERIIPEKNGPYALITWSDTDLHANLMQRIANTPSLAGKQPFYSCSLSKAELAGHPEELMEEVKRIFDGNPPFGALLDWERRIAKASDAVLHSIDNHAQQLAGASPSDKMDLMLSRLAVASFGKVHADTHRFEAVTEALLPMLSDALNAQFMDGGTNVIWNAAISKCANLGNINAATKSALNSSILIEVRESINPIRRGAILKLPESWLSERSFCYRFGSKPSELKGKLLKNANDDLVWIVVQAQAACDFNQPKNAPIPYFLGAIAAASAIKGPKELPNSVLLTPEFAAAEGMSEAVFRICIFHGSPCPLTKQAIHRNRLAAVARLKDQLVDAISHEHHNHGSRPGYLSF